jgi:S1-C subfamily serine protease
MWAMARSHSRLDAKLALSIAAMVLTACPVAPRPETDSVAQAEPAPAAPADPTPPAQSPEGTDAKAGTVTAPVETPSPGARMEDENNSIAVFQAAAPATVFVTNKQIVRDRWSMRALEVPAGTGSGFIWDSEGHVVTNAHVVANGRAFEVTDHEGRSFPATPVGVDPNHDIAVLKISPPEGGLTAIRLPPEDYDLAVGQKTLAIGNPFGLDHTLTVGVISALGREITGYGGVTIRDMIQTDASINPGNSGGPLLNSAGELIGMNTMIFSKSGSSAGIGFAVPVTEVRRNVTDIIKYGAPVRAGIGIIRAPDELARANGIKGVVVDSIVPDSPAASAGLEGIRRLRTGNYVGDIIVGIEEMSVTKWDDLYKVLDTKRPGDSVTLTVDRDGEKRDVRVTLIELESR